MKMKTVCAAVLSVVCAAALCAGGGTDKGGGQKTVTWKLAFNQSIEHPQAQALLWLSDEFFKATNGAYKIDVNPNELLGNQAQSLESLRVGAIQMAMVGNPVVEAVAADFAVIALPGLYNSVEHQIKVFSGDVLAPLFAETVKYDFYTLTGVHSGVRNVYTKKPVTTLDDVKGMKIRVMQSQLMLDTMNAMGAVGVAMSQGEVYTAIQQGVLDGAENNEITYYDLKQYEVAPNYTYTRHFMVPDLLIINKSAYEGLSAEHKDIFDRLVKEFASRASNNFVAQVDSAKQKAQAEGANFIEFDGAKLQPLFAPVIQKNLSSPARQRIYDAIRAVN